jgi:hypothetical protein
MQTVANSQKQIDADIIGLFEHNLDTNTFPIKSQLYSTTRQLFDHSKIVFSTSAIPSMSNYKPGGTMLVAQGKITGRVLDSGTDALGRWTFFVLSGKHLHHVTIISANQVCAQPTVDNGRIRTLTASALQTSMLLTQGRSVTPRQAFISDLSNFIRHQQQLGHGIILAGDFNEILHTSFEGMTRLATECGLTDIMYNHHGRDDFATYNRGSTRVDYVLCTDWIAPSVLHATYEPFGYRTKGDHRNMVLDFDSLILFGNSTSKLSSPVHRLVKSKDHNTVSTYIATKHQYLVEHKFNLRLQQLQTQWDPQVAEQLDRDWLRASFHAAWQCKKKPNIEFVQQIAAL